MQITSWRMTSHYSRSASAFTQTCHLLASTAKLVREVCLSRHQTCSQQCRMSSVQNMSIFCYLTLGSLTPWVAIWWLFRKPELFYQFTETLGQAVCDHKHPPVRARVQGVWAAIRELKVEQWWITFSFFSFARAWLSLTFSFVWRVSSKCGLHIVVFQKIPA